MNPAPITALSLGLAAVLLSACASRDRVPDRLLTLLDDVRAGGAVEIELDRDGAYRDLEAEIAVERVPAPIVSALAADLRLTAEVVEDLASRLDRARGRSRQAGGAG